MNQCGYADHSRIQSALIFSLPSFRVVQDAEEYDGFFFNNDSGSNEVGEMQVYPKANAVQP